MRRFQKFDFAIRKNDTDLDFLQSCQRNNLIPKFLNFKVANVQAMSEPVIKARN